MNRLLPLSLLALSACAQLPTDLPSRPALKAPVTTATLAALARETGHPDATPQTDHWWESFGQPELNRLIESALQNQPDLAAAQARLRLAEQSTRLARLDAQIHYETDATIIREHLSKNGLFPPPIGGSTFTQTDITQNLSYSLDWWGKNRDLIEAAGNAQHAAQDEAAAVRLAVSAAVADSYFSRADLAARLAVARLMQQDHRREHDLLKARFDLGLDSALPLIDGRKQLDLDDDRIRGLEYQAMSERYRLSALIGSDPDHAAALPVPGLPADLPPLPTRLPLDWLARRPDIAALRSRVEAAANLSAAAKADFYPNLDLHLMLGLETLDLSKLLQANSVSASIGPALHLPIFNGQTLRVKLGMREADYAASVAAYNRAILEAARQSADAYALIVSLKQRSQAQQQALLESEKTLNLARQREQMGLADPLDALQANSAVLGQRMTTLALQAARLRARVALYQALGGDTPNKDQTP